VGCRRSPGRRRPGRVDDPLPRPDGPAYLTAIGALTRTDLAVTEWLPLLVLYNLIFVLPPLLVLAGHVALGGRADIVLGRLRRRLGRAAREGFLWLLGLIGLSLLADALSRLEITN
jgi:hypothetical protein